MNRLQYWLHADTQYRVHSPFVFDMYRKVLFAPLTAAARTAMQRQLPEDLDSHTNRRYHEMVYKLADHYHLDIVCYTADEALLRSPAFTVKVVCAPHRRTARELRWQAQQQNTKYNVSIDIFDVGLLLTHPKLHPQHFLLK